MKLTFGLVMFAGGILGAVVCIIMLCILPVIFKKQKKRLMEELEEEYR